MPQLSVRFGCVVMSETSNLRSFAEILLRQEEGCVGIRVGGAPPTIGPAQLHLVAVQCRCNVPTAIYPMANRAVLREHTLGPSNIEGLRNSRHADDEYQ